MHGIGVYGENGDNVWFYVYWYARSISLENIDTTVCKPCAWIYCVIG